MTAGLSAAFFALGTAIPSTSNEKEVLVQQQYLLENSNAILAALREANTDLANLRHPCLGFPEPCNSTNVTGLAPVPPGLPPTIFSGLTVVNAELAAQIYNLSVATAALASQGVLPASEVIANNEEVQWLYANYSIIVPGLGQQPV